jgi:hypothetical protein
MIEKFPTTEIRRFSDKKRALEFNLSSLNVQCMNY